MPTSIHKLIKEGGTPSTDCDYDVLVDAFDAMPASLVTDDEEWFLWVENEMATSSTISVAETTDATRLWHLQANTSSSGVNSNYGSTQTAAHSFTLTDTALMDDTANALGYNSAKAGLTWSFNATNAFTVSSDYCHIGRMQFYGSGNSPRGPEFTGTTATVERCFIRDKSGGAGYQSIHGSALDLYASIVDKYVVTNYRPSNINSFNSLLHVTIVHDHDTTKTTSSVWNADTERGTVKNCAFFSKAGGSSACDAHTSASWGGNFDYCITDHSAMCDVTTGLGSNMTVSQTTADQFTAVDGTDWSLDTSTQTLDTLATDLTATVPYDIWGVAFSSSDTICGCEHYAAPAGGQPTMRRWGGVPGMGLTGRNSW